MSRVHHTCGWPSCGCDPTGFDSPVCRAEHANKQEEFAEKTARNIRVQARYDQLMTEGKHGHYETMFRVVREEVEAATTEAYAEGRKDEADENGAAVRLIDAWVYEHGKQIPWAKAVQIVAIVNKLPDTELARLLALAEAAD